MRLPYVTHVRCRRAGHIALGITVGAIVGVALADALFVVAVLLLKTVGGVVASRGEDFAWSDPVYTRAAFHSLADISISGLGISRSDAGGFAGTVLTPGSALLARIAANGLAQAGVLVTGLFLLRRSVHAPRCDLVGAAIGLQLEVAVGFLLSPITPDDLETIGLSFAINASIPSIAGRRLVVSDLLSSLPPSVANGVLVGTSMLCAYAVAGLLVALAVVLFRRPRQRRRFPSRASTSHHRTLVAAMANIAVLTTLSTFISACGLPPAAAAPPASRHSRSAPRPQLTVAQMRAVTDTSSQPPTQSSFRATPATQSAADRWYLDAAPAKVEIATTDGVFRYVVNGETVVIHGMGINTQYHSLLSAADRLARLDADLADMQALGVNTLVGWDPAEFDDTLLELAQRHRIGVVMPFDLDPAADYTDAGTRAALTQEVLRWVDTYRDYPAVRMWGLGNEVLHKIVHPAWVGPQDPTHAANARAFADWLIQTADAIHAADPRHPVTYRDAEDAFVEWAAHALARSPGDRSSWFVWGTNCYQDYLKRIVDEWPSHQMGVALWVSEFAPGGLAIPDRPAGFTEMWGLVRDRPDWVLGGAVYAWTRNGPEEIDRNLGLTDDGVPVDGRSLEAIATMWRPDRTAVNQDFE